jgi:hypothetical protein
MKYFFLQVEGGKEKRCRLIITDNWQQTTPPYGHPSLRRRGMAPNMVWEGLDELGFRKRYFFVTIRDYFSRRLRVVKEKEVD